ncbi:MAG: hypothetical protein ACWA5R_13965 [bacterium]
MWAEMHCKTVFTVIKNQIINSGVELKNEIVLLGDKVMISFTKLVCFMCLLVVSSISNAESITVKDLNQSKKYRGQEVEVVGYKNQHILYSDEESYHNYFKGVDGRNINDEVHLRDDSANGVLIKTDCDMRDVIVKGYYAIDLPNARSYNLRYITEVKILSTGEVCFEHEDYKRNKVITGLSQTLFGMNYREFLLTAIYYLFYAALLLLPILLFSIYQYSILAKSSLSMPSKRKRAILLLKFLVMGPKSFANGDMVLQLCRKMKYIRVFALTLMLLYGLRSLLKFVFEHFIEWYVMIIS